ncbi:MAG: T9SS type A sorting domain-containing protein, partial [Bacteroidetes bacterium]|nr:T9SS type A sorting domain-containing protein [Bacteroidota bacterium]
EMTTGLPVTQIFRNSWGSNTYGPNDPPGEPENLLVEIDLNDVTFTWSPADDDNTPSAALTYNLYLGNHAPAFFDIFAPLANATTGFVKAYAVGNTNQNTGWIIKDLPAGTYHWSVQTLDHSLCGSEFAPEQTFEITYVGMEENLAGSELILYPNPASSFIKLKSETDGELLISDIRGSIIGIYNLLEGVNTIPVTNLAKGIYLIRFSTSNNVIRMKFIKD